MTTASRSSRAIRLGGVGARWSRRDDAVRPPARRSARASAIAARRTPSVSAEIAREVRAPVAVADQADVDHRGVNPDARSAMCCTWARLEKRMHRQRHDVARQPLGHGKVSGAVAQVAERGLQMEWHADSGRPSPRRSPRDAHGTRRAPAPARRRRDTRTGLRASLGRARHDRRQHLPIPVGHLTALRVPLVERVGLHAQHRGLQVVEARRLADDGVFVLAHPAVVAQQPEPLPPARRRRS